MAPPLERLRFRGAERLTLVADAAGPAQGLPVVLAHGGGQSRRAWSGGLHALAASGYRAIALDLRGHGESDWSPSGDYALERYAEDLEAVLRAIDRPVAVVGASRGGQAALLTAAAMGDRVTAVVLIDVTPRTDPRGVGEVQKFLARSALGFRHLDEASNAITAFNGRPRPTDASGLERVMRRAPDGRWYWQWDPRIARPEFVGPPTERTLMEAAAQTARQPTLLVRAASSELVRPQDVAHFRMLKHHLEVVEIAGIGHMISGDSNHRFMPPVLEFLARQRALSKRDCTP